MISDWRDSESSHGMRYSTRPRGESYIGSYLDKENVGIQYAYEKENNSTRMRSSSAAAAHASTTIGGSSSRQNSSSSSSAARDKLYLHGNSSQVESNLFHHRIPFANRPGQCAFALSGEHIDIGGPPVMPFYSSSASSLSAPSLLISQQHHHNQHQPTPNRSRASTNATQAGSTLSMPPITPTYSPTPIPTLNTFVDELRPFPPQRAATSTGVVMTVDVDGKEIPVEYRYPSPWASDNNKEASGGAKRKKWFGLKKPKWLKGKKEELDFEKRYDIWAARLRKREVG
ncbi:hypothetical protein DFH27DRAFT_612650 [Peziza echinospora]|nr:hypothetical protein DFH27DRAFT_612650 [Peziza echinospora]